MLANSFLVLALGALASAQTFDGFPTSLTCRTSLTATATILKADAQSVVVGPAGSKVEDSAGNASSGKCTSLTGVPYYVTSLTAGARIYFAYKQSTDTYYYCAAAGVVDETGFSSQCTENN